MSSNYRPWKTETFSDRKVARSNVPEVNLDAEPLEKEFSRVEKHKLQKLLDKKLELERLLAPKPRASMATRIFRFVTFKKEAKVNFSEIAQQMRDLDLEIDKLSKVETKPINIKPKTTGEDLDKVVSLQEEINSFVTKVADLTSDNTKLTTNLNEAEQLNKDLNIKLGQFEQLQIEHTEVQEQSAELEEARE